MAELHTYLKDNSRWVLVLSMLLGLGLALSAGSRIPAWGDYQARIPDNARLRQDLAALLSDPVGEISSRLNKTYSQVLTPERIRFEVLKDARRGYLYLLFKNGVGESFPDTAPGNVVVWRDLHDGHIEQIKIFVSTNPSIFLRIQPGVTGSLLSIFFRDNAHPLFRELPLPLSIERAAVSPISLIMNLSDARVDWHLFMDLPDQTVFGNLPALVMQIRSQLKFLPDAEDGAMDETGHLVRIATLPANGLPGFNCSGFLKWLADGFYFPLMRDHGDNGTASYLKIDDLKERQLDVRGNSESEAFEESRDPFFGLDWTRNIAAKLFEARTGKIGKNPEEWDVRALPLLNYVEDRGYAVNQLYLALYLSALKEPGSIFLGAVNGYWGKRPVLWQYYHVLAFFPWFDDSGHFHCAVFERNIESSIESLEKRYPNEYMHLVRIKALKDFEPPRIQ